MHSKDHIKIVEVGPRDGLQNEKNVWSVEDRVDLIRHLIGSGLQHIEAGSFVSPRAIPQMAGSDKVWEQLKHAEVDLSFLVPNQKGWAQALSSQVKSIAVFTATSSAFTTKNINKTVEESLEEYAPLVSEAVHKSIRVRGYISTAFGCPYDGPQDPKRAIELTRRLFEMGCYEVSIGDTIGVAHPAQVQALFTRLRSEVPISKVAGHFHDTRGLALSNIRAAFDVGVRVFDSSIGGMGGCPYAPGSAGNVATEEVAWLFEGYGIQTGLSVEKLLKTVEWIEERSKTSIRSKFSLSKPKHLSYLFAG